MVKAVDVLQFGARPNIPGFDSSLAFARAQSVSKKLIVPPGIYNLGSAFVPTSGLVINGEGDETILTFDTSHPIISFGSSGAVKDVELKNFKIQSDLSAGSSTAGLINGDGPSIDGLNIEGVTINVPAVGRNAIFLKSRPGAEVQNVTIKNINIISVGRMGIEIIQHDDQENQHGGNIEIAGGRIANCGGVSFGMAISISGGLKDISIHDIRLQDSDYGIELVGAADAVNIYGVSFDGAFSYLIGNTGSLDCKNVVIQDNISTPGTTGTLDLRRCPNAIVTGNSLNCTTVSLNAPNIRFLNNYIRASASTVITIDNSSYNVVEYNILDNTPAPANSSVVTLFGANATKNFVRNNILRRSSGGTNITQQSGASANILGPNYEQTSTDLLQIGQQNILAYTPGVGTSYTATITLPSTASWTPYLFRITVAGCSTTGTNDCFIVQELAVRDVSSADPVIIRNQTVDSLNMSLNVTASGSSVNVVAVPGSGSPRLQWCIEQLGPYLNSQLPVVFSS